jgi:Putative adhesin
MKKLLAAFAVVALSAPALWAAQDETERVNQTVKLAPGGTLRLKSFSGRVNITAADADEVVIQAVRRASRDRLDHIKLDIHADGSTVYVDANKRDSWWITHNNVVETDFDIKVPRRTNIDVNVFSAPVTIEGVEGTYKIGGFSSRIRLEDVTGSVKAHTFSGPVEIRAKAWKEGQDVDVDTFSGNVTLRVPESARASVTFNSFSGHLNSDLPLTLRQGGRRSLKAELGSSAAGGGTLRFKTFSGSVRIDR